MQHRWLYGGVVALVVVASLFAFGAQRVWSESAAHGRYVAAQQAVHAALLKARRDGLTSGELSAVSGRMGALDRARAPESLPVFGSDRSDFYTRKTREYRSVQRELGATVRKVTRATRLSSTYQLQKLRDDVASARSLRLDVTGAEATLGHETEQHAVSHTPGQFRAVSGRVRAADSTLRAAIGVRQAAVNRVVDAAQHSLSTLQATARQSVETLRPSLSLLALVNARGRTDQASLDRQLAGLVDQTDISSAAVRMLELNDGIAAARKDVASLLPAKMIVVSTEAQSATAYQGGTQVFSTPVTTGGPELPTDHGVFHIYEKLPNFTFHSPWPIGSPYYYPPSFVQYWMPFYGGEGLHDASWRSNFGPGSNLAPTDLGTGNYILGTHGCVNLPTDAAAWVWNWAPVGTTVVVI
jgi:hypothetical protein